MDAYPGDMREQGADIGRLFADAHVAMVDTGHTHYNELLNDGKVIYSSTRSTAQVEENDGEAGFSLAAVDRSAVSWRFKPLASAWPFVLITRPADHRLVTDTTLPDQVPRGTFVVRAKVFGEAVRAVSVRVGDGDPVAMHAVEDEPGVWAASVIAPDTASTYDIVVRVKSNGHAGDEDRIEVFGPQAVSQTVARSDAVPGTDAHAVRAWPEHGVLGTQLGPNKYGKKW